MKINTIILMILCCMGSSNIFALSPPVDLQFPGYLNWEDAKLLTIGSGYDKRYNNWPQDRTNYVLDPQRMNKAGYIGLGTKSAGTSWMTMSCNGSSSFSKNVHEGSGSIGFNGFGCSGGVSVAVKQMAENQSASSKGALDAFWVCGKLYQTMSTNFGDVENLDYYQMDKLSEVLSVGFFSYYQHLCDLWDELNDASESLNQTAITHCCVKIADLQNQIYDLYGTHIVTKILYGGVSQVHLEVDDSSSTERSAESYNVKAQFEGWGFSASAAVNNANENAESNKNACWSAWCYDLPDSNPNSTKSANLYNLFSTASVNRLTQEMVNPGTAGMGPSTAPEIGKMDLSTKKINPFKKTKEAIDSSEQFNRLKCVAVAEKLGLPKGSTYDDYKKWASEQIGYNGVLKSDLLPDIPNKISFAEHKAKLRNYQIEKNRLASSQAKDFKGYVLKSSDGENMSTYYPCQFECKAIAEIMPGFDNPWGVATTKSIAMYNVCKDYLLQRRFLDYIKWAYQAGRNSDLEINDYTLIEECDELLGLLTTNMELFCTNFNTEWDNEKIAEEYHLVINFLPEYLEDKKVLKKFYDEVWLQMVDDDGLFILPEYGYILEIKKNGKREIFGQCESPWYDPYFSTNETETWRLNLALFKTVNNELVDDLNTGAVRFYPFPIIDNDGNWQIALTTCYNNQLFAINKEVTYEHGKKQGNLTCDKEKILYKDSSHTWEEYVAECAGVMKNTQKWEVFDSKKDKWINYYCFSKDLTEKDINERFGSNAKVECSTNEYDSGKMIPVYISTFEAVGEKEQEACTSSMRGTPIFTKVNLENVMGMMFSKNQIRDSRAMCQGKNNSVFSNN